MKLLKYISILLLLVHYGCKSIYILESQGNFNQILEEFHDSESEYILVAAHRALHTKYPENSLAAIQHSISSGVDIIEIDVRQTKDGKLVLMHDSTIDRTTSGTGELSNYTYAQLQLLELKKNKGDTLVHRIPLLKEALVLAKDKIMIDLDIKGAQVKKLTTLVMNTETENQSIFFDSEFPVLDSILSINPNLIVMPRARSSQAVDSIITKYHPQIIHIDDNFFTEEVVAKIKNSGARIWINALGTPDSIVISGKTDLGYLPLINGGANVIQTDLPVALNNFLFENNLR